MSRPPVVPSTGWRQSRRTVLGAPLAIAAHTMAPGAQRIARAAAGTAAASPIQIAPTRDHLLRDGRPFFYLADTAWAAFTNPTEDEWRYYLDFRRDQGFNALQINVLPQDDRSRQPDGQHFLPVAPFATDEAGIRDFSRPNPAYFERAARLLTLATERGFVPALVVLWGSNVPATTFASRFGTITVPQVRPYVKMLVDHFARFAPLWLVSGDSNLPDEARPIYKAARDALKELTPHLPCTFHMAPEAPLPNEWPDVYMTYSGHGEGNQDGAFHQAMDRAARKPRRPVINGEPCYEAHGRGGRGVGELDRWSASEVRRAAWWHLLSGGKAGLAYGAHGVWCWHRTGQRFNNERFARHPLDWRVALNLPGAWDMGFAKRLFAWHRLHELDPRQDLLEDAPPSVRCAATPDARRIAIYVPYARRVTLKLDLSSYDVSAVDLAERRFLWPTPASGATSTIPLVEANSDVLLLAEARAPQRPAAKTPVGR